MLPDETTVQKNTKCGKGVKRHVITWDYMDCIKPDSMEATFLEENGRGRETGSGELVRNLAVGDVVTLWGKARFFGWINNIEEVKMEVFWAV